MHGIGKGRKKGARNKTTVERLVDMIVIASGGTHKDTVKLLDDHWNKSKNRLGRGQNPVRREFDSGNKLSDRYIDSIGMNNDQVKSVMGNLLNLAKNPKTVSNIDT